MTETILVTGASGFIGKHCVKNLLEAGYTVRGTVRSTAKADAVRAAMPPDSQDRLHFATLNLLDDAGWAEAMDGCQGALHVASPVTGSTEADYIKPAVEGTRRVLTHAAQAGLRRVVLTSSVAAIGRGKGVKEATYTEDDWSNPEQADLYSKSKTLAERTAWAIAEETGLEIATINPGMVIGPPLDESTSISVQTVSRLLNGSMPAIPPLGWCFVDVRDVANAHRLALETPEASGKRFICVDEWAWLADIAAILRDKGYDVPSGKLPGIVLRVMGLFDADLRRTNRRLNEKVRYSNAHIKRVLGWQPRPLEQSVAETAEALIALGIVNP